MESLRYAPRTVALAALVVAVCGLCSVVAHAQDGGFQLADVPTNLPGHELAPRPKPAPQPKPEPQPQPQPDAPPPPAPQPPGAPDPATIPQDQDVPPDTGAAKPEAVSEDASLLDRERLTGNWWGLRDRLESRGIDFNASYTFEWSSVFSGGAARRASTRSVFDANIKLDLAKAVGWNGATVFVDFYSTDGRGGSADVGDFQGFSLIETDSNLDVIGELWFEQYLFDESLRFKLGKIDAAGEFAFINSASNFSNSASGTSPAIVALPDPATGAVVQYTPSSTLYASVGFFDGAGPVDGVSTETRGPETFFSNDESDDWFWIGEIGVGWSIAQGREGRAAIGVWHHTGDWAEFDSPDPDNPDTSSNTGVYALAEQRVHQRAGESDDSEQGVYVLGQLGWADGDVSEAQWHAAVGLSLYGTFEGRDDDSAGVYVSWVGLNEDAGYTDDEVVIETYYKVQITPWASIKPDLQVIFNPGGTDDYDTAVVGTLLFEVAF